jgi:flagella basal body P-ring formation protein FlgA
MRCCSKSTTWRASALLALLLAQPAAAAVDPPAVRAGDRVVTVAIVGAVSVEGSAVALQSGRLGGTIRLTNPDSRRQISGVIVAPGRVEVMHEP